MRCLTILLVLFVFQCVFCKNNVKSLTESMGQEVIEIGTPVKELPPEIEEEPSAEVDDDDKPMSTATTSPATKKDVKKTPLLDTRRKLKDEDVDDSEDARIEKELSEIYKDNADYKDTSDALPAKVNVSEKPVLRQGANFKFQPDVDKPREIERFRTSVDDISCAKNAKRLHEQGSTNKNKERDGKSRTDLKTTFHNVKTDKFIYPTNLDVNSRRDVDRFRTSIDDLNCKSKISGRNGDATGIISPILITLSIFHVLVKLY